MNDTTSSLWQRIFEALMDAPFRWLCRQNLRHTMVRLYHPLNDADGTCVFCGKKEPS